MFHPMDERLCNSFASFSGLDCYSSGADDGNFLQIVINQYLLVVHTMPVCLNVYSHHLFPAKHTNGSNLVVFNVSIVLKNKTTYCFKN